MTLTVDDKSAILRTLAPFLTSWASYQAEYRGATGVQLAIGHAGGLVAEHAWGLANAETGEPLSTGHLFRIASHSKTMTAVTALRLVERGELRLDDRVGDLVPELAGTPAAAVTVRELLGHQGGLIRDSSDGDFWQRGFPFLDREQVIDVVRREGAVFAPNEHFKYTNIGYSLLGIVLERASGRTYAELVDEIIVSPLGLVDSGPDHAPERAADYAAGHTGRRSYGDPRRVIPHVDTRAMAAATGWYSTARELTVYGSAHMLGDETMLTDASKRLMQRAESVIEGRHQPRRTYGLGLDVETVAGFELIGHSGGYPGHITRTWIDPADGLVVTVLTNDVDGPAGPIAEGLLQLIALAFDAAADGVSVPDELMFTGRFANLWGVVDVVDLGGIPHVIPSRSPDPRASAVRLVVDGDRLVQEPRPGYGETGEPVTVTRGADGAIGEVRIGAMTYWPLDTFRDAMALPQPHDLLGRMAL